MSITELPVPRAAGPASIEARMPAAQDHARGVLRDRLIADFPSVSPGQIGTLVDEAYACTAGARIQAFRVVLAERAVRTELHSEGNT